MYVRTAVIAALLLGLAGCTHPPDGGPAPHSAAASAGPVAQDFAAVVADNAAADLAELGVTGATHLDDKVAYLQGPHFSLAIEETAEVAAFDPARPERLTLDRKPFVPVRAGPGRVILLVRLHEPNAPNAGSERDAAVNATVIVAGQPRDLGRYGRFVDRLLAISVAPGAPVSMSIRDTGRVQSIDLRTGARRPDALAGYHPVRSDSTRLTDGIEITGDATPADERRFDLSVTVQATKYPYLAGRGWAAEGQAWLEITLRVGTTSAGFSCDVDAGKSFTVTGPAGAVEVPGSVLAATGLVDPSGAVPDSVSMVLDVPDPQAVTIGVTFVAEATCRQAGGGPVTHRRFARVNMGNVTVA